LYVLAIFEVAEDQQIPGNKTELLELYQQELLVWFHYKICPTCHTISKAKEWIEAYDYGEMRVFTTRKRTDEFDHWEPIFIGTNEDPFYDWEGRSDKMTQAYIKTFSTTVLPFLTTPFLFTNRE
jgi:beta-1,4-glucuronyltransferase 1